MFGTTLQQLPWFPVTFAVLDDHNTLRIQDPRGNFGRFRSSFTTCATDVPHPSLSCPLSLLTWTWPILRTAEMQCRPRPVGWTRTGTKRR